MTFHGPLLASNALQGLVSWLREPSIVIGLSLGSIILGLVSLLLLPVLVARIPEDYFAMPVPEAGRGSVRWYGHLAKNALGGLLLLLGIVMLVLPGQGLLTILAALILLDFPHKRRFELWVVQRPQVLGVLNSLRRRAGRPPLRFAPPNSRQP